jgi:hypothetical protein
VWWCALSALALLAWAPVQLEDTWFYAATGRWVVDHHAIARSDPFSWTVAGRPWQSNGWLWGVLLWGVWSLGRFAAVALLKPLYVITSGVLLRWSAGVLGASRSAAMVGALVGTVATFPFVVERPQLASYLAAPVALAFTHLLLTRARWWAWALALFALFALWTNLHSVALSGVPLVAAVGLGLAADRRRDRAVRPWLLAGMATVASALGTLVNPWGAQLWTHAAEVRRISRGSISEWEPLWNRGTGGLAALVIVVVVVIAAVRLGALRRLELLAPLVLAALLAADAIRSFPVFAVVAATVVPPLVPVGSPLSADRRRLLSVGAAAALVLALVVALPRAPSTTDPSDTTPVDPVAALPSGCRLLNDYAFGNWVMFDRPDVPVSDDGRNDLYGTDTTRDRLIADPSAASELPTWTAANGVTCLLVRPSSPAIGVLTVSGWVVAGRDGNAVAVVAPG